jgi:hypothetical protein
MNKAFPAPSILQAYASFAIYSVLRRDQQGVALSVASAKMCHSRAIIAELTERFLPPDNARGVLFVESSRCRSPSVTVATLIFTQGSLRQWNPPLDLPDEASPAVRLAVSD